MENKMLIVKPTFDGEIEAKIKSLGEIESNIKDVKDFAIQLNDYYKNLIFDENSMSIAKEEKAKVNKFKEQVSTYRKDIIKQWKEPIIQFETMAKDTEAILTDTYSTINTQCSKFDEEKKQKKEQELRLFFNEYCKSYEIDFIAFENIGLNITLAASEKSLKEQIVAYLDRIKSDLMVIDSQENKVEVFVEYKDCLDLNRAILAVNDRKKKQQEELKRLEEFVDQKMKLETQATAEALQKFIPNTEEIIVPKVVEETKQFEMTFTVKGTMEQLKKLKEYLKRENLING